VSLSQSNSKVLTKIRDDPHSGSSSISCNVIIEYFRESVKKKTDKTFQDGLFLNRLRLETVLFEQIRAFSAYVCGRECALFNQY
jgi:hypothetical protein